jgi:hypothetical protein
MQRVGVGLLVVAYSLLAYISLSAPAYARAHPHLTTALLAEYAAPWPVALGSAFALLGVLVALFPVRRREPWAYWTSLTVLVILMIVRIRTDPRCLVVLDPHQHGCHTFMIAMVLGLTGVALAALGR